MVIQVVPIPAKSVGHLLDGDAHHGLAVRVSDVAVLTLIALVQISWLALLVYATKSVVG